MRMLIFMLTLGLSVVACSDLHTSDNGMLDGFWQMTQVDTLANGHSEDARHRMIFWAVQGRLLEMNDMHDLVHAYPSVIFRFEHKDGQLRVYEPVLDKREISDSLISQVRLVSFYGVYSLDETFRLLRLEPTQMTVENEKLRMHFRKY